MESIQEHFLDYLSPETPAELAPALRHLVDRVAVSAMDPSRLQTGIDRSHPSTASYSDIVSHRIQSLLGELPAESSGTDRPGQDYLSFWFSKYREPLLNLINSIFNVSNITGAPNPPLKFTFKISPQHREQPPSAIQIEDTANNDQDEIQGRSKKRKREPDTDVGPHGDEMDVDGSISVSGDDSSENDSYDDDDEEIISIDSDDDEEEDRDFDSDDDVILEGHRPARPVIIDDDDDDHDDDDNDVLNVSMPDLPNVPRLDLSIEMQDELAKAKEEAQKRRRNIVMMPITIPDSEPNPTHPASSSTPKTTKSTSASSVSSPPAAPAHPPDVAQIPPATGEFASISNQVLERLKLLHDIAILEQSLAGHSQKLGFQRSEFFGDSVLEYYVSITLYKTRTFASGAVLSATRTFMVTNRNLADVFDLLRLRFMLPWRSFDENDLKQKADVVEAIIGELDLRLYDAGRTPTQIRLIEETRDILVSFIMYIGERNLYRVGGPKRASPASAATRRERTSSRSAFPSAASSAERQLTNKQRRRLAIEERRKAKNGRKLAHAEAQRAKEEANRAKIEAERARLVAQQHRGDAKFVDGPKAVALYPDKLVPRLVKAYDAATPRGWDKSTPYRFYLSPPFPPPPNISKLSHRQIRMLHQAAIRAGMSAEYAGFLQSASEYPALAYLDPIVSSWGSVDSSASNKLAKQIFTAQKQGQQKTQSAASAPSTPSANGSTTSHSSSASIQPRDNQRLPPSAPSPSSNQLSSAAAASVSPFLAPSLTSQNQSSPTKSDGSKLVVPLSPIQHPQQQKRQQSDHGTQPLPTTVDFESMFMTTSAAPLMTHYSGSSALAALSNEMKQKQLPASRATTAPSVPSGSFILLPPPAEVQNFAGASILQFPTPTSMATTRLPQQQAPTAPPKLNPPPRFSPGK